MIKHILTIFLVLLPAISPASIENLDELETRKARRYTHTYYSGESASNGWNRQSESLGYLDMRTGHEVWVLSNTKNRSNIYYTDISPANPWSADGKRLGFFSNRPVSEFNRVYGSILDGQGTASTFTVNSDGSALRAAYDSSERTWGSTGTTYFYWSPVLQDVYYTLGSATNGLSLDKGAIYKNVVTDTGTTYSKWVDIPGLDTDTYSMKKVISPDGQYLLPKKDGKYFPIRVYPDASKGILDADGWAEDRGQSTEWGLGPDITGCRHDVYFPSPDFFVILFSNMECSDITPIFYKYNVVGTDVDGGPDYINSETTYSTWNAFEVEPMWNAYGTKVPWKLEPLNAKHFWGHPGFDRWGRTVTFGDGNGYVNIGGRYYELGGPVTWDYKNRKLEGETYGTLLPLVMTPRESSYNDHNGWTDYFAQGSGGVQTDHLTSWIGSTLYNKVHTSPEASHIISAYHYDNTNLSTSYNYTSNCRVAQSPDGTKISYAITYLTDMPNTGDIAYSVAYNPHPPEITSVTNSAGTYTIRFDWRLATANPRGYTKRGWPVEGVNNPPPPRETDIFRLWRSTSPTGPWEPRATVNANTFSRYDFRTGDWISNDFWTITDTPGAGTFYYAVTAKEYSGLESRILSNVYSTSGSQVAAYPIDPKADADITTSYIQALTRYYNIYAEDGTTPSVDRRNLIASIPISSPTTYVDWLGALDGTTKHVVTAVDTQGNESTPLLSTSVPRGVEGQYTITWTSEVDPSPTPTCSFVNYSLCTTVPTCQAVPGLFWCDGRCQDTACPVDPSGAAQVYHIPGLGVTTVGGKVSTTH